MRWIISRSEGLGNEIGGVNLIPTVEPNGLYLFEHDLGCPQVLSCHLHGEETAGNTGH